MRLHVLALGTRMPPWVERGFADYAERFPREMPLRLREVALERRAKGADSARARRRECQRLMDAVPGDSYRVALDAAGEGWSTEQLADEMRSWLMSGQDVGLLIGGPEGLDDACRQGVERLWSLSRLTLPHPLVRIIVAEQLYRAWSIIHNHPYHRGG